MGIPNTELPLLADEMHGLRAIELDVWHRRPEYPDHISGVEVYNAVLNDGVVLPNSSAPGWSRADQRVRRRTDRSHRRTRGHGRAARRRRWALANAYPFVRLHQSSTFYGVASRVLGGGRIQTTGPEAGLHERADQPAICAYYGQVLAERMVGPGRVEFFPGCDYVGGRALVSRQSGERFQVTDRCRIVDARYLAPDIPPETPPKFDVAEGVRVVPVNDLPRSAERRGRCSGRSSTRPSSTR